MGRLEEQAVGPPGEQQAAPPKRSSSLTDARVMSATLFIGFGGALLLAQQLGLPFRDSVYLVAIALVVGVFAEMVGWGVISAAGGVGFAGVRARAVLVSVLPVVAVVGGVSAAAQAMFVSSHDFRALGVVLVGAATMGVVAALRLANQVERTRADLVATHEENERLHQSTKELVAWMSHDLRTPLAGITAMAEALADGVVTDPVAVERYHQSLDQEARRLGKLVDDLFELSRLQVREVFLPVAPAAIAELLGDAIASTAASASAKQVTLECEIRGDLPVTMVSAADIQRVIHNLLDNAIQHTPANGNVAALLVQRGEHLVLEVRDACGGIPESEIDRVFDRAFRGDAARSPGASGGGLGLAIAKGLVEAHSGTIEVHNEVRGCCFTVTLPIVAPAQPIP